MYLKSCRGQSKKITQFHFTGYKTEKKQHIFNIDALKYW